MKKVQFESTGQARCPFLGFCVGKDCMLFLTASKVVIGPRDEGEGSCSFAILASHIASEEHSGGNYLMPVVVLKE